MEPDRTIGICPTCLLTPSAEQLLTRLKADLLASRAQDATWSSVVCPDCGRTTAIRDDREGWTFGDSGWTFEPHEGDAPVAGLRTDTEPPAADLADTEPPVADLWTDTEPLVAELWTDTEPRRQGTPEWLTIDEVAYLTGTPAEIVGEWLDTKRLEPVSILGEARLGVLVRAEDVIALRGEDLV